MAVNPELAAGWTAQKQNRPVVDNAYFEVEPAANVAAVATANADATYGQPEADLINELKTKLNAEIAALKAVGLQKTS